MPNEREIGATKTMWSIPYSLTPAREDVDKGILYSHFCPFNVTFNFSQLIIGLQFLMPFLILPLTRKE